MANKKIPKNPQNFCCTSCDYYTSNKKEFTKLCQTIKRLSVSVANETNEKIPKNPLTIHSCEYIVCIQQIYTYYTNKFNNKNKILNQL